MDKLSAMKVFAAVARLGSFSAAADELGISRAMASKHIGQLENHLNVRLFNRTTRHLNLTEVGKAYQDKVNTILSDIEETELAATSLHVEPRGKLKIMAPPSFGSFHLARAFCIYKERYPGVTIELLLTDRTPDLFEEDGIDLAIFLGQPEESSMVARKLASTRIVVCGSPAYLANKNVPATPADLVNHNCLTLSHHRSSLSAWKFIIDGKDTVFHPNGNLTANTADPLRIAAINGCGLVQLPTYLVGLDIRSGKLVRVLEDYEPDELPIYAIYIHRRHLSNKVRTFVDFMSEYFQPVPYWDDWMTKNVVSS